MFGWLFRRAAKKRMVDPVFGDLLWRPMKDPNDSYWEGRIWFAPSQDEVDLMIAADEGGPGAFHHSFYQFYQELNARYPELLRAIAPLLEVEVARWLDGEPNEPVKLELDTISIPNSMSARCSGKWDSGAAQRKS